MKDSIQVTPSPIRVPLDLKRWLKAQAETNHRSFNGEVVMRLQESRRQQENREAA
ncbi:MAG: Arc family DNA-binding protein [Polycyclovorans sp.]|nr:Arc family DNA-binding protein [Polycyclovorans sp.]